MELDDYKVDSLFPTIDRSKTIAHCKHFLAVTFPSMIRRSGMNEPSQTEYEEMISGLKSPSMDGMPKAASAENHQDVTIIRRLYAQQVVKRTVEAISHCDQKSKEVLSQLYLDHFTDTMCWMNIGYSKSQYFDQIKPEALLQFADAYLLDDLHIYEDSK